VPFGVLLLSVSVAVAQPAPRAPVPGGAPAAAAPLSAAAPLRVVKAGAVTANRAYEVPVPGARVKIGDLADRAFRETRTRNSELQGAQRALLAPVVQEETFTENDASTTLECVAKFTVVDPDAFRAQAPSFKSYNAGMRNRAGFSVSKLSAEAKAGYDAFKVEILKASANHPLRIAAQQSDDALLDAIAQGKGDVTVRTRVTVPKSENVITGKRVNAPKVGAAGLDYSQPSPKELKFVPSVGAIAEQSQVFDQPEAEGQGSSTKVSKFLTGFTKHRSFDWEERWEFGTRDYFSVGAHAGYALGLRIPVEVTTRMTPTKLTHSGLRDVPGNYDVFVSARTFDAPEQYYLDAGLSKTEAYDGKEFVLEADAYATVDVVAGWGTIKIHERVPGNAGFDFGQNFAPPFGNCGTNCGVDVWVPAAATRTELNILGVVTGRAQIGFNVGGTGTVGVDYTSLYGNESVDSKLQTSKTTHSLSFAQPGERQLITDLVPITGGLSSASGSRSFGYKLSNPNYAWNIVITPGVKGTVNVNARPFFSVEEVIGPYWLRALAVELGTVNFAAHAGTKSVVQVKTGQKSYGAANVRAAPMGTVQAR
jgi:hypothetical protein